jgi:apolipoprotein D and lipocalin family protein
MADKQLALAQLKGIETAATAAPPRRGPSRTGFTALVFAIGLAAPPGAAGQARPVQIVEKVDLSRYVGEWFEIARFPNRFQRQCLGDVRAVYAIRQDGRLDVVNRCRTNEGVTEARGVARIVDSKTAAKLKVRFAPAILAFLPAVWGDYWVVGLAPDYSWATVGSPDRKYLWILGRAPAIGTEPYAAALEAATSNGYDVARLIKTEQAVPAK